MKAPLRGLAAAIILAGATAAAGPAEAAMFGFSFSNENGTVAGSVSGTITLPNGDGTFAASSVVVNAAPAALGYAIGFDFVSLSTVSNSFTVAAGAIAASDFFGLFNGATALSLNGSAGGGLSFLDALDAANLGATGVLDSDNSTLAYTSATAVPEPVSLGLFCVGLVGLGAAARRRTPATA